MTWNHRVVRKKYPKAAKGERVFYGIHEVYYDDKGRVNGVTDEPIRLTNYTVGRLREELEMILKVLHAPVLDFDTIAPAKRKLTHKDTRNPAAVALGALGGAKGGKARAASLTGAERRAIASHAAKVRWEKEKK